MEERIVPRRGFYQHANLIREGKTLSEAEVAIKLGELDRVRKTMRRLDNDTSKELAFAEIVQNIKSDIQVRHSLAGIEIHDSDFPLICFKKLRRKSKSEDQTYETGRYKITYHLAYTYMNGQEKSIVNIISLYHELVHSVGKVGIVWNTGNKYSGQLGFRTVSGGTDQTRGEVLEEGLANYLSYKYIATSNLPAVKKAREEYVSGVNPKDWDAQKKRVEKMSKEERVKYLTIAKLIQSEPDEYRAARNLIITLIKGAELLGLEKSQGGLENDLLAARIDPYRRSCLVKKIDQIFGEGIARQIFRLNFDAPLETNLMIDFLRKGFRQ